MNDELFVNRVLEKLDRIERDINDLCIKYTKLSSEYNNHIQQLSQEQDSKIRRRDFAIVIFGSIIGGIELLRSLGVI